VQADPRPPSEHAPRPVMPALEAIVLRCLAKRPESRFASARELRAALLALPDPGDWNEAQARQWWRAHASGAAPVASPPSPPRTLTVDLDTREARALGSEPAA
jgi:eukaryotic-like serine/threonine-protein kinase